MKKLSLALIAAFLLLITYPIPSSASSLSAHNSVESNSISTHSNSKIVHEVVLYPFEPYPLFQQYYYYNKGGYSRYLSLYSYSFESDYNYHVIYRGTVYKSGPIPIPSKVMSEE